MATKSEWFRYQTERSGPKKKKVDRPDGRGARPPKPHNVSARAEKKALYALEPAGEKPSRKSSRKAANRQKTDVQFRMKRKVSELSPPAR